MGNVDKLASIRINAKISAYASVDGAGVPVGGSSNQILTKNSSDDYDVSWKSTIELDSTSGDSDKSPIKINMGENQDAIKFTNTCSDEIYGIRFQEKSGVAAYVEDVADVQTAIEKHVDDVENPHQVTYEQLGGTKPTYTKEDVGLGNVDNTSDADKPISIATQIALDNKVDKSNLSNIVYVRLEDRDSTIEFSSGKTTPYTMVRRDSRGCVYAADPVIDNELTTKRYVDTALNNKVDKVSGKQLSTNDFTDADKTKLAAIESESKAFWGPLHDNPKVEYGDLGEVAFFEGRYFILYEKENLTDSGDKALAKLLFGGRPDIFVVIVRNFLSPSTIVTKLTGDMSTEGIQYPSIKTNTHLSNLVPYIIQRAYIGV